MITNATISRVDAPGTPSGDGTIAFTNGASIDVPCLVDEPTSSQKYMLGAVLKDVTAAIYVSKNDLAVAGVNSVSQGMRVVAQITGETPVPPPFTYLVRYVRDRVLGSVSHWEVFGQEVAT